MSLSSEFKRTLVKWGLEWFGRYYGSYRGIVVDSKDPENRGRLKVKVPTVLGNQVLDYWAPSKGMAITEGGGVWLLPKDNDTIWVEFENGDPKYPIWVYGWVSENDGPEERNNDNYILQTANGNFIEVSDDGDTIILKTASDPAMVIEMSDGKFLVEVEGVGSLYNVLDDKLTAIEALTVSTVFGPSSVPINVADFVSIQETLGKFMK